MPVDYKKYAIVPYKLADFESVKVFLTNLDPWKSAGFDDAYYQSVLDSSQYSIRVIELESQVVGLVTWRCLNNFPYGGYVRTLAVKDDRRGQGVGTALLREAEDAIFEEYKNSFLCVDEDNAGGRSFYTSNGYKEIGVMKDYLQKGDSFIMLRKSTGPLFD